MAKKTSVKQDLNKNKINLNTKKDKKHKRFLLKLIDLSAKEDPHWFVNGD